MNTRTINAINRFAKEVHENAIAHGWWDENRSFGELIAMCHAELSEALEEYRNGESPNAVYTYGSEGNTSGIPKLRGIPVELADVILRVLDMCAHYNINIGEMLNQKHEFNKTRSYRHGGKKL